MRIYKNTYKDRTGETRLSAKWYGEFRDHTEQLRRLPLLTDKAASAEAGRKIERLVALRLSGEAPDADLSRWLLAGPQRVVVLLAKWGIVDQARLAGTRTLAQHLADYEQDLASGGNTSKHAEAMHYRVKRVLEGCGFRSLGDFNRDAIKTFLNKLRKEKKVGARTYGYYVRELKAFGKWLMRSGRVRENPFANLEGLGAKALAQDPVRQRRALSVEEIDKLLPAALGGPERYGLTGRERALVYRLAVETGLRVSELASLTRSSFRLEGKVPLVQVAAGATKNAKAAELPLRAETVALLEEHLKLKLPAAKAFAIPPNYDTADMLRADLAAAGIADTDAQGRVVDFHALRHTFLTLLAASGVHPKVAQDLARHSDINLTMSRYSHTVLEQRSEAIAKLPVFGEASGNVSKPSASG
ncbi:MAG: tyrosine-type recombinase/integrase [Planctomycetes bacterium]|nr:tyrosine-type recombinase/integrase [Planctomycetota bacterium]